MRFVSFATPKYHLEACSLVQSLEVLGLDYHVAMLPDAGSWVANCGRKAEFMLSVWDGDPMCWVDADSRVLRHPGELDDLVASGAEVAYHTFERQPLSGTVLVAGGGGRRFLEEWRLACQTQPSAWDQRMIPSAVRASGAMDADLSAEYCFIYDLSRKHWPDAKPVIEHYQASRRLKR